MAWYKCGGGGIPSSLKDGMNGVLNKKFGTSTTYAPDTWVDTVNLMGKLPEKTVSGSIAHITDGADRVPMKNCVCDINATLDGVSSVDVMRAGKNIFDKSAAVDGYLAGNGTSINLPDAENMTSDFIPVVEGETYNYSCTPSSVGAGYWTGYAFYSDKNMNSLVQGRITKSSVDFSFVVPTGAKYIRIGSRYLKHGTAQLEIGSTSTEYESYNATTHTVSLGQTIHGGSVDVVTGTGTKTWKEQNASDLNTWRRHAQGYFYVIDSEVGDKAAGELNIIGEDLTTVKTSQLTSTHYSISGRTQDGAIYVYLTGEETLEEFHAWIDNKKILFELAEPQTVQLTPQEINTLLGANNIWCNTGDTSVTYRRDITLALEEV